MFLEGQQPLVPSSALHAFPRLFFLVHYGSNSSPKYVNVSVWKFIQTFGGEILSEKFPAEVAEETAIQVDHAPSIWLC
jgi:hypothetical protein